MRYIFLIDLGTHVRGIDRQIDILLYLITDLVYHVIAELRHSDFLEFDIVAVLVFQFRQRLDVA